MMVLAIALVVPFARGLSGASPATVITQIPAATTTVTASSVSTVTTTTVTTTTVTASAVTTEPGSARPASEQPTATTPNRTGTFQVRLADLCREHGPSTLLSAGLCPYKDDPPTIAKAVFVPDAAPRGNLVDGHYYEEGGWASIITANNHTCTSISLAFGRADSSGAGKKAYLRVETTAGTTGPVSATTGSVGSLTAQLTGSPFKIRVSSDGGVPIFVRGVATCSTESGYLT